MGKQLVQLFPGVLRSHVLRHHSCTLVGEIVVRHYVRVNVHISIIAIVICWVGLHMLMAVLML